jgi:hypothetical protein
MSARRPVTVRPALGPRPLAVTTRCNRPPAQRDHERAATARAVRVVPRRPVPIGELLAARLTTTPAVVRPRRSVRLVSPCIGAGRGSLKPDGKVAHISISGEASLSP